MTFFAQKDALVGEPENPVNVGSKWAYLSGNEAHTFAFFDNDVADCAGTPLSQTMGDGFTTDAAGFGKIHSRFDNLTLAGENSIAGKYLQLSDSNG